MKKKLLLNLFPLLLSLVLATLINNVTYSQATSEFTFHTPVLESGIAGEDGARYRFSNVTTNIDAVVELKGRSSSDVIISNIDTTDPGLGYDKAFQPVLGIPGTAPSNSEWWMDFTIYFYKSGTTISTILPVFSATGIDIDGDDVTINEWAEMHNFQSVDTSQVNNLKLTSLSPFDNGYHYRVSGIITNSPGIDTSATNVMATYNYTNKAKIDFRIGATTSTSTSNAAMRLNSLWFKQFYAVSLPVKLNNFQGSKNKSNVQLQWNVGLNEIANTFEVERSTDGKNFSTASLIFGTEKSGNETYSYNEVNEDVKVYYRLKMVDKSDVLTYSKILVFNSNGKNTKTLDIIGNSVSDKLTVSFQADANNAVELRILDMNGKMIVKQTVQASKGNNLVSVSLPSAMMTGMYLASLSSENVNSTAKFIKQ